MVLSDGSLSVNQNIQSVRDYTERLEGEERERVQVDPRRPVGLDT